MNFVNEEALRLASSKFIEAFPNLDSIHSRGLAQIRVQMVQLSSLAQLYIMYVIADNHDYKPSELRSFKETANSAI